MYSYVARVTKRCRRKARVEERERRGRTWNASVTRGKLGQGSGCSGIFGGFESLFFITRIPREPEDLKAQKGPSDLAGFLESDLTRSDTPRSWIAPCVFLGPGDR